MKVGYFLNNVSNVLRIVLLLLLRFGGLYFDSDVISTKPVPDTVQVSGYLIYKNCGKRVLRLREFLMCAEATSDTLI